MKPATTLLLLVLGGGALATTLPACFTQACTLASCYNRAELHVFDAEGRPLDAFAGLARFEDGTSAPFECPPPGMSGPPSAVEISCQPGSVVIEHEGKVIVGVSIESMAAAETADVDLRPELESFAPNGEECGPVCQSATVDVHLEPAS